MKRCKKLIRRSRAQLMLDVINVWSNYQFSSNISLVKKLKTSDFLLCEHLRSRTEVNLMLSAGSGKILRCSNFVLCAPLVSRPVGLNNQFDLSHIWDFALDYVRQARNLRLFSSERPVKGGVVFDRTAVAPFSVSFYSAADLRFKVLSFESAYGLKRFYYSKCYFRKYVEALWDYHKGYTPIEMSKRSTLHKNNKFILHYMHNRFCYLV